MSIGTAIWIGFIAGALIFGWLLPWIGRKTKMNEWISVKERLPEDDPTIKRHIEGDKFGFLTVLAYNGVVKQTSRFFCDAPRFGLPKTDGWEWASTNVTHWMPLPPPPGEEEAK